MFSDGRLCMVHHQIVVSRVSISRIIISSTVLHSLAEVLTDPTPNNRCFFVGFCATSPALDALKGAMRYLFYYRNRYEYARYAASHPITVSNAFRVLPPFHAMRLQLLQQNAVRHHRDQTRFKGNVRSAGSCHTLITMHYIVAKSPKHSKGLL